MSIKTLGSMIKMHRPIRTTSILFLFFCTTFILLSCRKTMVDQDTLPQDIEFKMGAIDSDGKFVIKPIYDSLGTGVYKGRISAAQKMPIEQDNRFNGYQLTIDLKGNVISRAESNYGFQWKNSFEYSNDDIRFYNAKIVNNKNQNLKVELSSKNQKYGLVNKFGTWVVEPQWDFMDGFGATTFLVWNFGHPFSRWGVIDSKGHYLLEPTCVSIENFEPEQPFRICRIPFTFDGKQL